MTSSRKKHVPRRTCVSCRHVRPKRELVRVVRTPEGDVVIDETGKRSGRGAYLCPTAECWETALSKGLLKRALRTDMTEEARARLKQDAAKLQE